MARKKKKVIINNQTTILGIIGWLAFFASLADAVSAYIQSSYLHQFLSMNKISLLIGTAAFATFFVSLCYPRIIAKIGNYHSYLLTGFISLVTSLILAISQDAGTIMVAFLIRYISLIMILVNLDIFLEGRSNDQTTGSTRSRYLTVLNLAYLLAPLVMGLLVGQNQYIRTFYLSFWLMSGSVLLAFVFSSSLINSKKTFSHHKVEIISPLKHIWKTAALKRIFIAAIVLQIFYSLAVLYIPMHLNSDLHIGWATLGKIFTVMLLPFVLFQYPAGIIADKYLGEKEMLIGSALILISACLVIPFTTTSSALFWACLLFYSRIGAAIYETMQETYFYRHVDATDISLITMFRQTRSIGWMLGAIISFIFLPFTGIAWLFVIVAIIMSLNLANILRLRDTK